MKHTVPNPWMNISIKDTIADCDKPIINSLPESIRSLIEDRTLPEPYHGDKDASVYILCGNPLAGEEDLKYIGMPNYEKEIVEELRHDNTDFLWLREDETIVDAQGNPYPAYKYWKDRTRELREVKPLPSLFCIEAFPYHTVHAADFMKIGSLPSDKYTNEMIQDALDSDKYIVIMRCKDYWFKRVPDLKKHGKLLELSSSQSVYLSRKNLQKSLPNQSDWLNFLSAL